MINMNQQQDKRTESTRQIIMPQPPKIPNQPSPQVFNRGQRSTSLNQQQSNNQQGQSQIINQYNQISTIKQSPQIHSSNYLPLQSPMKSVPSDKNIVGEKLIQGLNIISSQTSLQNRQRTQSQGPSSRNNSSQPIQYLPIQQAHMPINPINNIKKTSIQQKTPTQIVYVQPTPPISQQFANKNIRNQQYVNFMGQQSFNKEVLSRSIIVFNENEINQKKSQTSYQQSVLSEFHQYEKDQQELIDMLKDVSDIHCMNSNNNSKNYDHQKNYDQNFEKASTFEAQVSNTSQSSIDKLLTKYLKDESMIQQKPYGQKINNPKIDDKYEQVGKFIQDTHVQPQQQQTFQSNLSTQQQLNIEYPQLSQESFLNTQSSQKHKDHKDIHSETVDQLLEKYSMKQQKQRNLSCNTDYKQKTDKKQDSCIQIYKSDQKKKQQESTYVPQIKDRTTNFQKNQQNLIGIDRINHEAILLKSINSQFSQEDSIDAIMMKYSKNPFPSKQEITIQRKQYNSEHKKKIKLNVSRLKNSQCYNLQETNKVTSNRSKQSFSESYKSETCELKKSKIKVNFTKKKDIQDSQCLENKTDNYLHLASSINSQYSHCHKQSEKKQDFAQVRLFSHSKANYQRDSQISCSKDQSYMKSSRDRYQEEHYVTQFQSDKKQNFDALASTSIPNIDFKLSTPATLQNIHNIQGDVSPRIISIQKEQNSQQKNKNKQDKENYTEPQPFHSKVVSHDHSNKKQEYVTCKSYQNEHQKSNKKQENMITNSQEKQQQQLVEIKLKQPEIKENSDQRNKLNQEQTLSLQCQCNHNQQKDLEQNLQLQQQQIKQSQSPTYLQSPLQLQMQPQLEPQPEPSQFTADCQPQNPNLKEFIKLSQSSAQIQIGKGPQSWVKTTKGDWVRSLNGEWIKLEEGSIWLDEQGNNRVKQGQNWKGMGGNWQRNLNGEWIKQKSQQDEDKELGKFFMEMLIAETSIDANMSQISTESLEEFNLGGDNKKVKINLNKFKQKAQKYILGKNVDKDLLKQRKNQIYDRFDRFFKDILN